MTHSIVDLFYALKQSNRSEPNRFTVRPLPGIANHKVGISAEGYPVFFVQCENPRGLKTLDCDLEFIKVQYNRACELINEQQETVVGDYTVILLQSDTIELQGYFLEIVYLLVGKLGDKPSLGDLKTEVDRIINLFSKFNKPATKTVQGLWAELLTIQNSANPEYLIQSWHHAVTDTFDFNDGIDKIEVKSTSKGKRVHRFSLEQLTPNKNSRLIIVSLFVIETGKGKSVIDLIAMLGEKISAEALMKVNEIVTATLGKDFEKSFHVFFDYQHAVDNIGYFDSNAIPSIAPQLLRQEISNVKFDCDLTYITPLDGIDYESTLHVALFS